MGRKKSQGHLSVNMMANLTAFIIHAGIQFFVIPILSEQIGNEAYGFIGIANEFVQYANIFTILLNGVVARFVAYEIHRGKIERANQYFNSVLIADIMIAAVMSLSAILFISRLEKVLVISKEILPDVKIIFALTFLNFIIVTIFSVMNVATFVTNRIDIAAIRNIIGYFIELLVVICLFVFCPVVKPFFLIAGTLISTLFLSLANVWITRRLLPELTVSVYSYNFAMMKDLMKTGMWSSISQFSNVLLGSTVMIMGNIFLGGNVIGLISLSKSIPNCMNTLFFSIYNVFTPNMVRYYAQGKYKELVKYARFAMTIMSVLVIPITIGVIVYAPDFMRLWLAGKTYTEIIEISNFCRIIAVGMLIQTPSMPLMYFAVATNKIRKDTVFSMILSGIFLLGTFIGLKYYLWGGEVIVLSQTINTIIKSLFWTPIYAAKTIGEKWSVFYECYIRAIIVAGVIWICYVGMKNHMIFETWQNFFVNIMGGGCIGYIVAFVLLVSREQKKSFLYKIQTIVKNIKTN